MRTKHLNPSFLNFVAGAMLSVGVNLVTMVVNTDGGSNNWRFAAAATPWVIMSVLLALAATDLEHSRRSADLLVTAALSEREKDELNNAAFAEVRRAVQLRLVLALLLLIIGVILVLALFPSGATNATTQSKEQIAPTRTIEPAKTQSTTPASSLPRGASGPTP